MQKWKFTFDGIQGVAEAYQGGAYIFWGGMGFHLNATNPGLRKAILAARPNPFVHVPDGPRAAFN